MKRAFLSAVFIILASYVCGQDIFHCPCYPQYDMETGQEITNAGELPEPVKLKLDSLFAIYYHDYYPFLKFETALKYDKERFGKRYNKDYKAPYIDVVYSLYILGKVTDRAEYRRYCVLVSLDSLGHTVTPVNLPAEKWKPSEIITAKKALKLAKQLWQSTKEELFVKLAFDRQEQCFVWGLYRKIEGPYVNCGQYGRRQEIIINAHTGAVVLNRKYCSTGFL